LDTGLGWNKDVCEVLFGNCCHEEIGDRSATERHTKSKGRSMHDNGSRALVSPVPLCGFDDSFKCEKIIEVNLLWEIAPKTS
jgi:hypothetical protein